MKNVINKMTNSTMLINRLIDKYDLFVRLVIWGTGFAVFIFDFWQSKISKNWINFDEFSKFSVSVCRLTLS